LTDDFPSVIRCLVATARLKDRLRQIPNGYVYTQPETNWDSVKVLGRHPSFLRLCTAVLEHRTGNPRMAKKNKWNLTMEGVEADVEAYNVAICLSNGWHDFVTNGEAIAIPKVWPPQPAQGGGVAGAGKRSIAGIKLVVDWLGSGLKPVSISIAEKRAAICASCPQNQEGDFWQRIGAVAAQQVKTLVEVKNDLQLRTSQDDKLHSCQACDCYLKLKVHCELKHVLANTSEDTKKRLDPNCWILKEAE